MKRVFVLFLFSALAMNFLAACGDTGKQTADESTDSLVENVSESTEKLKSNRREADFDNYVFRIITRDDTNTTWRVIDVVDSEENIGDSINDAVYKRNMAVSEEYNITFERIATIHEQIVATVSKLVLAGDDTFDALQTILTYQSQLAAEGYGIAFNFYQYMKNFHYPKPVRCFRIGNPADTTSYSIVTLKGKQTLPAMEELIRLLRESA